MTEVLLTSESFVKGVTSISDNLAGKYLRPSIKEAQEVGLRSILGDKLTDRLKTLVSDGEISKATDYKELLDRCQYYLAYSAVVEVAAKVSYKIGNFGVTKSKDENIEVATHDEISKMQYYYQAKADAYCQLLQHYLLDHADTFPELSDIERNRINANLYSAASSGIFLGGARGRKLRGGSV